VRLIVAVASRRASLPVGDVALNANDTHRLPVLIAFDDKPVIVYPDVITRFRPQPVFTLDEWKVATLQGREDLGDRLDVIRVQRFLPGTVMSFDVFRLIAQHAGPARTTDDFIGAYIPVPKGIAPRQEGHLKPLLAFAERRLSAFQFRDVADDDDHLILTERAEARLIAARAIAVGQIVLKLFDLPGFKHPRQGCHRLFGKIGYDLTHRFAQEHVWRHVQADGRRFVVDEYALAVQAKDQIRDRVQKGALFLGTGSVWRAR